MAAEANGSRSSRTTDLTVGDLVQVRVTTHQSWGVTVQIIDHEHIGASVDGVAIGSPWPRAQPEDYPAIGTERSAVVIRVRKDDAPPWVYLSMLPADVAHPSEELESKDNGLV
ncbi:hypothetical protein ACFWTE_26360 [Nocardiopsis sp. NPDC058631]|uniref:hypothetical protein n=1 Tax=Nocardiopsis sp. NPDC058631 TaxID=3346566 RepID=UPI003654AE99